MKHLRLESKYSVSIDWLSERSSSRTYLHESVDGVFDGAARVVAEVRRRRRPVEHHQ